MNIVCIVQELGGVRYMVLSHRDDVCDHARWAEALGCQRIIHKVGRLVSSVVC